MGAIERASTPPGMSPSGGLLAPEEEGPIFKPPKRKKKGFVRRFVSVIVWLLLLGAALIVGAVRFAPQFIPPVWLDSFESLRVPFLFPTVIQTSVPAPSGTPTATAPVVEATATVHLTLTQTPTKLATATVKPTSTPTVDPASLGAPTHIGGTIGQVAFASIRLGIPQIFIINTDSTNLVQLTNLQLGACQPSWSPDGSQLAFISPCRARGEVYENLYSDAGLYLINADGSGLTTLTDSLGGDFDPAWSPDGARIAFTSNRDGQNEIYTLDIASGEVTRLTTTDGDIESAQPSWSRDGSMIAYTVKRLDAYQVWAMSANGEDKVQLVRSGQQLWDYLPFWSLDGSTVFFNQRNLAPTRPWLMSIPFVGHDALTPTKLALPTPIEDVEFSPDGLWLIFESSNGDGNRDIYFSTVSGANRTRLTDDREIDFDPAWRPAPNP